MTHDLRTLPEDCVLVPEPRAGLLRVRFLGLGNQACERAFAPLMEELNATRTIYPGTNLTLVYEMSGDPQPAGKTVQSLDRTIRSMLRTLPPESLAKSFARPNVNAATSPRQTEPHRSRHRSHEFASPDTGWPDQFDR